MPKYKPKRQEETIIPQDLSYLPGGDNEQSASSPPLKHRWIRFLVGYFAALFVVPALKLIPLAIVAGGIAWAYGSSSFDLWQIPFNLSSNIDPTEWLEDAKGWSRQLLADCKNMMTTEPASQQGMSEEINTNLPNSNFPTVLLSREPPQ